MILVTQALWAFSLQTPQLYPVDVTPINTKKNKKIYGEKNTIIFFWVSNTKYNYVYSRNNTYQTKLLGKYCKKLVWNVKQYAMNA